MQYFLCMLLDAYLGNQLGISWSQGIPMFTKSMISHYIHQCQLSEFEIDQLTEYHTSKYSTKHK